MQQSERAQRWAWLVTRAPGLKRSLRARLRADDVEDVAQEALLRASLAASPVPSGSRGTAWLNRIARNIAIDRWRRESHLAPLEISGHVTTGPEASVGRIDLEVALGRLRPSDRRLLSLIASGARYAEIARDEGVDAGVIRQRVARARARVLAALKEGS